VFEIGHSLGACVAPILDRIGRRLLQASFARV